jgi:hypothetical protein
LAGLKTRELGAPHGPGRFRTCDLGIESPLLFSRAWARDYPSAPRGTDSPAVYTQELFATNHDEANRAAVAAVPASELDLAGIAFRAERRVVDKVVDRLRFHP